MANIVTSGDIHERFALISTRQRFLLLVRRELELAPELHASRFCPLTAFGGARPYQLALELRQTCQDREHEPAVRRRGVRPAIRQKTKARFLLCDGCHHVE